MEQAVQQEFNPNTTPSSPLSKLDPYKDSNGVIRVSGRLDLSDVPGQCIHPAILPKTGHVTEIVIRHYHHKYRHEGRGIATNEIKASGYRIVEATSAVSFAICTCVTCCTLRGKLQEQRMAELPHDRLETVPPFTNCVVDYFCPFVIREGRKDLKRYGVLFTCMASRAVHVEVATTLETDSFSNAFRFVSRRGPIWQLRSDQSTNFVGARRELKAALEELDHDNIRSVLQCHHCGWFVFKMNVLSASHMGGVWERQIRSVCNVLSSLLQTNGFQFNHEAVTTFMCEAEAIVNSRPLTTDSLNNPTSLNPLTPNHLLTMKTKVLLPPPFVFEAPDKHRRKHWRRVQHLANEFWIRWKKEYLLNLQQGQK